MKITETYPTIDAAKDGVRVQEALGRRILHENTYPDGTYELVIDDSPDNTPLPVAPNPKAAYSAASSDAERLSVTARYLGLE